MALEAVPKSNARLAPPNFLARAPAREWVEIVNSLPAGYFRPSDVPILAAYCQAAAVHKECIEILAADGLLLKTDKGTKYAHPAHSMMLQQASCMAQLAVKLRLCPSARFTKGEKPQKGIGGGGGKRPWDEEDEEAA